MLEECAEDGGRDEMFEEEMFSFRLTCKNEKNGEEACERRDGMM